MFFFYFGLLRNSFVVAFHNIATMKREFSVLFTFCDDIFDFIASKDVNQRNRKDST